MGIWKFEGYYNLPPISLSAYRGYAARKTSLCLKSFVSFVAFCNRKLWPSYCSNSNICNNTKNRETCNENMQLSLRLRFIRQLHKYTYYIGIWIFREGSRGAGRGSFPFPTTQCLVVFKQEMMPKSRSSNNNLAIWQQQQTTIQK